MFTLSVRQKQEKCPPVETENATLVKVLRLRKTLKLCDLLRDCHKSETCQNGHLKPSYKKQMTEMKGWQKCPQLDL